MALSWHGVIRYHGRGSTGGVFLLGNSNWRANIFDVF